MKLILLLLCIWLAYPPQTNAQTRKLRERSMVTGKNMTLTIEGNYKEATKIPLKKQLIFLYKRDSKGLSLGNVCAEQTMEMYGFQYEIVPERHEISRARYFFHNMWADVKLFFNNGPFWKARAQKIIDKCRQMSGDYVED